MAYERPPPHFGGALPRQPMSFRERVLFQFRSKENLDHIADAFRKVFPPEPGSELISSKLSFLLHTLPEAAYQYGTTYGQGGALLDSDPLAMRGSSSRSGNLLEELKHLNQAFFQQRIREVSARSEIAGTSVARTGGGPNAPVSDEPLFYQMFVNDSLRPPGNEHLNDPGPLWRLDEDRAFASQHDANPSVPEEDHAWSAGQKHRTAEQALAEYYGEETPLFSTFSEPGNALPLPPAELAARTQTAMTGQGPVTTRSELTRANQKESVCGWDGLFQGRPGLARLMEGSSGARFERREGIPYWQRAGHRAQLYTSRWQSSTDGGDVDETLGNGSSEFGGERAGHVRRWNMDRLRHPRGESYMRLGPQN